MRERVREDEVDNGGRDREKTLVLKFTEKREKCETEIAVIHFFFFLFCYSFLFASGCEQLDFSLKFI